MHLLCPDDQSICLPVRVGDGTSETGPRLGGDPPQGILPSNQLLLTRYFATVPISLEPDLEASIFLSFDFAQMAKYSGILCNDELVQVVIHEPSRRGSQSQLSSNLSAHPLIIKDFQTDWVIDDGIQLVESGHKIGGRPYIIHNEPSIHEESAKIMADGFVQIIQLDFPGGGGDAIVSGDWPFADGMFHLFGKVSSNNWEWKWFWEF
jgi:hypothetical protein